jgi:hypothetical protein
VFREVALLFRQLSPSGFQGIRFFAGPRHDWTLSEKLKRVAWKEWKL